jgi:hypothetical protein
MPLRVFPAGAFEPVGRKAAQAEIGRFERRMLAGQHEPGSDAPPYQRMRNRRELDGFGPGPDDQPHIREMQRSP